MKNWVVRGLSKPYSCRIRSICSTVAFSPAERRRGVVRHHPDQHERQHEQSEQDRHDQQDSANEEPQQRFEPVTAGDALAAVGTGGGGSTMAAFQARFAKGAQRVIRASGRGAAGREFERAAICHATECPTAPGSRMHHMARAGTSTRRTMRRIRGPGPAVPGVGRMECPRRRGAACRLASRGRRAAVAAGVGELGQSCIETWRNSPPPPTGLKLYPFIFSDTPRNWTVL